MTCTAPRPPRPPLAPRPSGCPPGPAGGCAPRCGVCASTANAQLIAIRSRLSRTSRETVAPSPPQRTRRTGGSKPWWRAELCSALIEALPETRELFLPPLVVSHAKRFHGIQVLAFFDHLGPMIRCGLRHIDVHRVLAVVVRVAVGVILLGHQDVRDVRRLAVPRNLRLRSVAWPRRSTAPAVCAGY